MLVNCCLQFPVLSNQLNAVPILSNQLNARVPNRHRTSRFQTDTGHRGSKQTQGKIPELKIRGFD
jgi:hypothetical protein